MQSHKFVAMAALSCLAAVPLPAQTFQWFPTGVTAQGNSNNAFPWNRGSGTTSQIRIQFQYANANFAGITTPIFIQEIRFRAQDTANTTWTGGTYSNCKISMSTATADYLTRTTTFATNHGADLMQVYPLAGTGPIDILPGTHNGAGFGPTYVVIKLAAPFPFDPNAGKDLVVDIQHDGTTVAGMSSVQTAHYSGAATSATPALSSRLYNTSDWNATTGSSTLNYGAAMEIGWIPQSGLFAGFNATPTSGGQNLTVQFKDTSFSSDPGGITSWTWDFGDGSPVSNLQNPTHTYKCGTFSPKLTVTDASHPASTKTLTDYISAGIVDADFTVSGTFGTAPYTVNFTDTSTGGPTAWSWDFGDGSPVSNVQNPSHTYAQSGKFTVTLKVAGGCNSDSETKTDLIEVCPPGGNLGSLSTIFTGGNGLTGANVGNMFKVSVINNDGLKITSIDVNTREPALGVIAIDVYISPDDYVGKNAKRELWVKVASGTAASAGGLAPTNIDVNDFYLAPGNYGMYVNLINGGVHYTTGNATNLVYRNCDLQIETGYGMGLFSSGVNSPRVWNGALHYAKNDAAANGKYGYGCVGSNSAIPDLSLSAEPMVGGSGNIVLGDMLNQPSVPGFLFIGATKQIVDLTALGMPGCFLHTDTLITLPIVGVNGTATLPFTIANNPALVGNQALMQAAAVDAAANALGVAASNGLQLRIGN